MDRYKFGYEDTDKKIEIELYGLVFEIKNVNNIKELEKIDDEKDKNEIERTLEQILGDGAIEKINNKRKEDGYEPMDITIELNIFGLIFEVMAKNLSLGLTEKIDNSLDEIDNRMNNTMARMNKRRNYRRNNRRNYY